MTTHLSTRLVWHDRAWDGHICDHPSKNAYCMVQKHIREGRDDDKEDEAAGRFLDDLDGWQPPCSRDPIAFSPRGYTITHNDPLEFRQLPSVTEEIPPYSVCPSPYRWMREEHFRMVCETEKLNIPGPPNGDKKSGWVFEPDRQIALLKNVLEEARSGQVRSSSSTAITATRSTRTPSRILLGVGPHQQRRRPDLLRQEAAEVPRPVPDLVPLHHPRLRERGLPASLSRIPPGGSRPDDHPLPCPGRGDGQLLLRRRASQRRRGGRCPGAAAPVGPDGQGRGQGRPGSGTAISSGSTTCSRRSGRTGDRSLAPAACCNSSASRAAPLSTGRSWSRC